MSSPTTLKYNFWHLISTSSLFIVVATTSPAAPPSEDPNSFCQKYATTTGLFDLKLFNICVGPSPTQVPKNPSTTGSSAAQSPSPTPSDKYYAYTALEDDKIAKLGKLCAGGNMESCLALGMLKHQQGDQVGAKPLLKKSCDGGISQACANLQTITKDDH